MCVKIFEEICFCYIIMLDYVVYLGWEFVCVEIVLLSGKEYI